MAADLSREERILNNREERMRFFREILEPEFEAGEADKVMICGKSGSGKTALSALLIEPNTGHEPQFYIEKDTGSTLRLHGTIPRGRFANPANQNFQISSSTGPGTVEPMGLTNGRGGWYWDCPGFYNPTGDAEEILNAVRFRQLVSRGGIKFLLVMQKADIQDRLTDVVDIYKRLVRMFPDVDKLLSSTQLVIARFSPGDIEERIEDDFRGTIQRNADRAQELERVFIADAENPDIALRAMNLHRLLVRQMGLFPSPGGRGVPVGERYDSDGRKREAIEGLLSTKVPQRWPDAHLSIGERAAVFLKKVCEKWVKEFCEALTIRMPIPERFTRESFDDQVWMKFKLLEGLKLKGSETFFGDIKEFLTPELAAELERVSGHLNQFNVLMGSSINDFDGFILRQKRFIVDELSNAINLNVIAHQVAAYVKGCIYFNQQEQEVFWRPVLEWDERIDAFGPLRAKIQRLQQRNQAEQGYAVDFLETTAIQTFLKELKPGIWRSYIERLQSYFDKAAGPSPEQRIAIIQSFDLEVVLRNMDAEWRKGEIERKLIAEIRGKYPRVTYEDWKKFRHRNFHYSLELSDRRVVPVVENYSFTTLPMFESFLIPIGLGADGLFAAEERDRPLAVLRGAAPQTVDIRDLRTKLAQQQNESVSTLDKCHEVLSIPLFVGVPKPEASPNLLSMWLTPNFFCEDANGGKSELITVVAKYKIPRLEFDGRFELADVKGNLTYEVVQKVSQGQLKVTPSQLCHESRSYPSFKSVIERNGRVIELLSFVEKEGTDGKNRGEGYSNITAQLERFERYTNEIDQMWEALGIGTMFSGTGGLGAGAITVAAYLAEKFTARAALAALLGGPWALVGGTVVGVAAGGAWYNSSLQEVRQVIESAKVRVQEARVELARVRAFTLPLLQSWKDCRLKFAPDIHLSMEAREPEELVPSRLFADVVPLSVSGIRNIEGRAVADQQALLQQ